MRADEPITYGHLLRMDKTGVEDINYINQLRVDRLMRGKKIAELERRIAYFEYLRGVIGNKEYFEKWKQCDRVAEALEARAERIEEGM